MHFPSTLTALIALLPLTNAFYKGMNIGANNEDGSCKTTAQWTEAFTRLKNTPQHITSVRLYASSDCNTLASAVPAALSTGTQILAGVWAADENHYAAENAALKQAIQTHGHDWLLAISVGSEDLYRAQINSGIALEPSILAARINATRTMVRDLKVEVQVGHVDTWTAWINATNEAVITASEFIGLDAYPYFQNVSLADAYSTFWDAVDVTRKQVNAVSPGKWVWITETGWPVSGTYHTQDHAIPSVANAQHYWRSVACEAFKDVHVFWYAYQDYNSNPSFGMFDRNGKAIYDLYAC
ncbi:Hypothetical protein R9X50_00610200 [Acrodontium crateriforme]|uniref:Probable glucan endo-1,3-beta-glucosidase eglC n=1 Tax=Acrodontium crateriforme TaxID=150365 RepID=A0AAQ3RBZ4_9PEZI|nr:Hypothetical protein R9X50_00610200 [Acrodontium crateriforme]